MQEFPKMLYREGDHLVWEGRNLATRIVHSVEDEAKALKAGWQRIHDFLSGLESKVEAVAKRGKK